MRLFEEVIESGKSLAFMAHFNHPRELQTKAVEKAIKRILNTGAIIRTQSPIMNHINNQATDWAEMWKLQVKNGCIPYYMFIARNTGAQGYFAVTLEEAWKTFKEAYRQVSGIARTVRGPIMSSNPGKVQILGVNKLKNEQFFTLRFIQGRRPEWVGKPFFAKYDSDAIWLTDLEAVNENGQFFFEEEFGKLQVLMN